MSVVADRESTTCVLYGADDDVDVPRNDVEAVCGVDNETSFISLSWTIDEVAGEAAKRDNKGYVKIEEIDDINE